MKEKKVKCLLCDRYIMTKRFSIKQWYRQETVHVKCGNWLDEIFHKYCWDKLHIDTSP